MSRNPYAPPQAPLSEAAWANERGPRPPQVTWAVRLLWIELAVSGVDEVLGWPRVNEWLRQILAGGVVLGLLTFEAWVICQIARGKNWARWVALVSAVFGVLISLRTLRETMVDSPIAVVLEPLALVLDAVALYLLFSAPGRAWFRRSVTDGP